MASRPVFIIRKLASRIFGGRGLEKFRWFRVLRRKFYSLITPSSVSIRGLVFYTGGADGIFLHERYQKCVADVFERELVPGNTVLDLGANIGYFTCLAAKLVGDSGRVFAFEPEPFSFSLLKKNVEVNKLGNVVAELKAVSDKSGVMDFFPRGAHGSLGFDWSKSGKTEPVRAEVVSLDDYFKNFRGAVDFVKLNIIGSEEPAVRGMRNLLRKNSTAKIVSIFNPILIRKAGGDPLNFLNYLAGLGFKIYDISIGEGFSPRVLDFGKFVRECSPESGIRAVNIFCER